jgi:hypothetical protein
MCEENSTQGFCNFEEFKCAPLTHGDYESLIKLRDRAREIKNKTKFLEELSKTNSPYEIEKLYLKNKIEMREFSKNQRGLEYKTDLVKLPNEALFDNLEEHITLRGFIDFICNDGGEIRGPDVVYDSNGNAIRMRVYWK